MKIFTLYSSDVGEIVYPRLVDKIVVTKSNNGMLKTAYNRYQRGRTSDNCRFLGAFVGLVILQVYRNIATVTC